MVKNIYVSIQIHYWKWLPNKENKNNSEVDKYIFT